MDTNNEILDAIEILADKKISENITKVLTGICTSVNINKNTCVMDSNGVSGTVYFYGSPPEVNGLYRIFVPSNNMSRSFIVVPPKFTVNPNLLDNWYFGNPVNQRGQTEYTSAGYTVDRWKLFGSNHVVTIKAGFIALRKPANTQDFVCAQYFERSTLESLRGKTITISVMGSNGNVYSKTLLFPASGMFDSDQLYIGDNWWVDLIVLSNEDCYFRFVSTTKIETTLDILAAKLELGSTQTLAHLENGNWVLNEIPDYGEQLRKCQRYYQVHPAIYWLPQNADGTNRLTIPIPDMRAFPVVTYEPADGNTGTLYYDANLVQKDAIQFYAIGVTGICGVKNIKLSADL